MLEVSFKERVKNVAISVVHDYKKNYVDYEYLICSDAFVVKDYYIIDAKPDNYPHLIGVHSLISPQDFYDKCYNGTLKETDFDFVKQGHSEKSVIGSVRRKILALPNMITLFQNDFWAEETFIKNNVVCTFATTDNKCTLGFIDASKSRPKSLIKGNELDATKAKSVNLLLKKQIDKEYFDEIIIGDSKMLMQYYEIIRELVDKNLFPIAGLIEKQLLVKKMIAEKLEETGSTSEN